MTTATTQRIEVGTQIFNTGDVANLPHFGAITAIREGGRYSDQYEITPAADAELGPYWITASMISDIYDGTCKTRIVTRAAYDAHRASKLEAMTIETIIEQGLETLSQQTRQECANNWDAVKWLLVIRICGDTPALWLAAQQTAVEVHDRGEYDGFEMPDGSVLGSDANGYNTWETLADWLAEFPAPLANNTDGHC